jgi:lambda repressor-like predicted transcriptional regulator
MNLWKYYNGNLKYPDLSNHSHEIEIAKANPKWAYEYAKANIWEYRYTNDNKKEELKLLIAKELEPLIAKDTYLSFFYASAVTHERFKLGEKAIAKDAYYSYLYAEEVLRRKPFPLGEPIIAKSEKYAKNILNQFCLKTFI